MALKIDVTGEYASAQNPWTGGPVTIVYWMRRPATTTQFQTGLVDTDDATPHASGDPRITIGTASGAIMTCTYTGNGGSNNNATTATYSVDTWTHIAGVFKGSGTTIQQAAVAVGGTLDTFAGVDRDLSINGTLDALWIGSASANTNAEFAHYAVFLGELTQSQITELQTKLPTAITGASPIIYYPLLEDGANDGTGGATYDLTLNGASIDSTNDGSLPSLSSGGPSGTLAATESGADAFAAAGDVLVQGTLAATESGADAFAAASSSGNIRLSMGIYRERGGTFASATGLRYVVFNSAHTSVIASGSSLTTDANGVAVLDLNGTEYSVGDYVPVLIAEYNAATAPQDRVVRTMFGFVPAIAQS